MNCRDIENLLSEGKPLTAEAEKHVRDCAACRSLLEVLSQPGPPFDSARVHKPLNDLLTQLAPVTPLPSDRVLIAFTLGVFVAFTLVVGAIVGVQGYLRMTPAERLLYCGAILFFGLLFSVAAAGAAIPGSKVRVPVGWAVASCVVALACLVTSLFPYFELNQFVSRGVPCLRFGCGCGALFGLLSALFLNRGYVTKVRTTTVLIGCFGGLSGVAALSLHCSIQNAPHILVWHLGAIAVGALGGFLIGEGLRLQMQRNRPDIAE